MKSAVSISLECRSALIVKGIIEKRAISVSLRPNSRMKHKFPQHNISSYLSKVIFNDQITEHQEIPGTAINYHLL